MDFQVSDEMAVRLEMIREFMDREVIPLEQEMLFGDPAVLDAGVAAAQSKVKQMGLWAPNHPVEYGGLGLSMVDHGLFAEAVGRSPLGMLVFGTQAPDAGNVEILHEFGTPEQHEQFLRPLVAGEVRSCFSMTEPETSGSNPTLLATTARLEGDEWVVNGQKWFTSSADGAAFAIVMAVTDPDAPPHQRASMIIVPTDTPGFHLVRNVSVMGHSGSGHASHAEVIYQGCRVPKANLLGPQGSGFLIAQARPGSRLHHQLAGPMCEHFQCLAKGCGQAASRSYPRCAIGPHPCQRQAADRRARHPHHHPRLSVSVAARPLPPGPLASCRSPP